MQWVNVSTLERIAAVQTTDGRIFAAMHKITETEKYVVSFTMINAKGEIDVMKQSIDRYEEALVRFSVCKNMCEQWQALLDKKRKHA